MGKFKEGEKKLMDKGMSKQEAGGIMAKQGVAKYGKAIMQEKAEVGRKKAQGK